MIKKLKYILPIVGILGFAGIALANPLFFGSNAQTSIATTTPVFLVVATSIATTTGPVYDSYEVNGTNEVNQGQVNSPNTAALLIQFTASSTTSVLGWTYEYSQDAVDWYSDDVLNLPTTSTTTSVSIINAQIWVFASSTIGGQVPGTSNNIANKIVNVPVPTRYVRPVFYISSTARGAIWAQFVPKKELK